MAFYDPAVQVHSCYLNNPREKAERIFDNVFQLVDLWSANEMIFEKSKDDKIQVAVKDENIYFTFILFYKTSNAFRLTENCTFRGSIESCCNEISFVNTYIFFF